MSSSTASASTPPPDLKSLLKSLKSHLDAGSWKLVISDSATVISDTKLVDKWSSETKQRGLVYTLFAFVGLAQFNLQLYTDAIASYQRAISIQDDQFPAFKGLYDVYSATHASRLQLRPVLEKLVALAPAGLKKIAYNSQLSRLQLEQPTATSPQPPQILSSLQSLLTDALISSPSAAESKDASEISRINLEIQTSIVLASEAIERSDKEKELKVRLDRQLKKYRDEKVASDKVKAQQAASKSGAIAAAVKAAKGASAGPTQEQEEAEIIRKVTLKLEKDFLEKTELDNLYSKVLALPSPSSILDPNHKLIHERVLLRMALKCHVSGSWTASPESFTKSFTELESFAEKLHTLCGGTSPLAIRILTGLWWDVGGSVGDGKQVVMKRQEFFEKAIEFLTSPVAASSDENLQSWNWMIWHALASMMISSEVAPKVTLPSALQSIISALPQQPSLFELAELIIRHLTEPSAAASSSSSNPTLLGSSFLAIAPSPLCPSYLSLVTLSYALQKQGESKHRECLSTLASAQTALAAAKNSFVFDSRIGRGVMHMELTLAKAYASKTLDERMMDKATGIFQKVLKSIADLGDKSQGAFEHECHLRALNGLCEMALHRNPPDYNKAGEYIQELCEKGAGDDWAWSMRGFLKFQSLNSGSSSNIESLLKEAAEFLNKAVELNPSSAEHHMKLAQVYWAATPSSSHFSADNALSHFKQAEQLIAQQLSAPLPPSKLAALKSLLATSLAFQGLSLRESGNLSDAKKLFTRSLSEDPANEQAGEALIESILHPTGASAESAAPIYSSSVTLTRSQHLRIQLVHSLASAAVQSNPRAIWSHIRLARCQKTLKDLSGAISSFQNSLRLEGNTLRAASLWEELAEAYNSEGQFMAAFKAQKRALELIEEQGDFSTNSMIERRNYCRFQLAQCHINLGSMPDAITLLESTLAPSSSKLPLFLPSIKLLSEALYVNANMTFLNGGYLAARLVLDRAINVASDCIKILNEQATEGQRFYGSIYKLLGDCYALYNELPLENQEPSTSPSSDTPLAETKKINYLTMSVRAYSKAIHIDPTASQHWYDAALSSFKSCIALHAPASSPPANLESTFRDRSTSFIKSSLVLSPSNTCAWHLLGMVNTNPLIRQHAFCKAVTVDSKDAIGWTSLGCFYLQSYQSSIGLPQDERQVLLGLSRHSLEISQTLDPSNPSLWTGQGIFNQGVASLAAYVQAKACFQRSLEIYPSILARFGLAYTAYCTGDISSARIAIIKFTEQYPLHATAWNLSGLIMEHVASEADRAGNKSAARMHAQDAVSSFEKAESLLNSDPRFATKKNELLRGVQTNRARALLAAGDFAAAILLYQTLIQNAAARASEAGANSAIILAQALTLHVDLAMAYAKSGSLAEALNVLGTGIAISAQQIASIPAVDPADPQAPALFQQKDELILGRRVLLLTQAQLSAMGGGFDQSKVSLQQSVAEHPEHPHPIHYFHVMSALYALSLKQGDLASSEYAISMLKQCLAGLTSPEHTEIVSQTLQPTLLRIEATHALLTGDLMKVRRIYQKLIMHNPGNKQEWNRFFKFLLQHTSSPSQSYAFQLLLDTLTIPRLDESLQCTTDSLDHHPEQLLKDRLEIGGLVLLAGGRTGFSLGVSAAASKETEEEPEDNLFKPEEDEEKEGDDEEEYKDEGEDEDVRSKVAGPAAAIQAQVNVKEEGSRLSNLTSSRLASSLIHIDPTSLQGWSLQAFSAYSNAIASAAVDPASAAALFGKVIKLLQLYSSLLTQRLSIPQPAHSVQDGRDAKSCMADLCNAQALLVDSLLRRNGEGDLSTAQSTFAALLEQQQIQGSFFPLDPGTLHLLRGRCCLVAGEIPQSISCFREAIQTKPEGIWVEVWNEMGEIYMKQGQMAAAEACFTAPISLIKANPTPDLSALHRALLKITWFYIHRSQPSKALESALESTRETGSFGSSSPTAFFLLGLAHNLSNHPDQALRAFQESLNLKLMMMGGHERSAPLSIRGAVGSFPLVSLRFHTALLLTRSSNGMTTGAAADGKVSGSLQTARDLLREELAEGISSPAIYYQLALTSYKLNDLAAASSYISSALQFNPQSSSYLQLQQHIEQSKNGSSSSF